MWADGSLERFDECAAGGMFYGFDSRVNAESNTPNPQRFTRNASLKDFYDFVEQALRAYQGYFIPMEEGDDWVGRMPCAFLLEKGLKLLNRNTTEVYTIEEVFLDEDGDPTGEVLLSGETAPTVTDNLEFVDCGIKFTRASPMRTAGVDQEDDATRKDTPTPWSAYIDFAVVREEPGVLDTHPSGPARQRKPAHREMVEGHNQQIGLQISGFWLDAVVRFDLWGATDTQAEELVQWFYNFMDVNTWVFQYNGIKQVLFKRRGLDTPVGKWRQNMYHRPIDYEVRTERLYVAHLRRIEHIQLSIQLRQDSILEDAMLPRTGRPVYLDV